MVTLEQLLCVKFSNKAEHPNVRAYIKFRSHSDDGCSSHIGFSGREQLIKIGPGCNTQHTILHEICHALGLWHEQTRPDRDNYLTINEENIVDGKEHNFLKRNLFEVDSQGEGYDYASVMHYRRQSFSRNGSNTLDIKNNEEYQKQGQPNLGRVPTLSKSDVMQLRRNYNCPGSGSPGNLAVYVQLGENLPVKTDAYVKMIAYDDSGFSDEKVTEYIEDTGNPVWNTLVRFGERTNWQYIDVSVWDHDDTSSDDRLTATQSFSVNPGQRFLQHCGNSTCERRMTFSISLTKTCHCLNGGKCRRNYSCRCTKGYGGPHCQYLRGKLSIHAIDAKNLINKESSGKSDPYLVVLAYDHSGNISTQRTHYVHNDNEPLWNEDLDFGVSEWGWFTIQAWDRDTQSGDDRLSYAHTVVIKSHTTSRRTTVKALGSGSINFDYTFQPEKKN